MLCNQSNESASVAAGRTCTEAAKNGPGFNKPEVAIKGEDRNNRDKRRGQESLSPWFEFSPCPRERCGGGN